MFFGLYKLEGHIPVPVEEVHDWARWYKTANRRVSETFVGGKRVSSVFLGLDHNYLNHYGKNPLLFETLVFENGESEAYADDIIGDRYSTWDEAVAGHNRIVKMLELTEGK